MSKGIELKGFEQFYAKIKAAPQLIQKEISAEIEASSTQIVGNASKAAPTDLGELKNGISYRKVSDLKFEIISSVHYSPYIEFGTGALVNVPPDLQEYAIQFKGKGIKQVNIPARPFFFPAIHKEEPELVKRIKNILDDI